MSTIAKSGSKNGYFSTSNNKPATVTVKGKTQTSKKTEVVQQRDTKSKFEGGKYTASGKYETSRKDTFKGTYQTGDQSWGKEGKETKGLQGLAGKGLAKIGNKELGAASFETEKNYKTISGSVEKTGKYGSASAAGEVKIGTAYAKGSGTVGIEGGKLVARGEVAVGATAIEARGTAKANLGKHVQAEVNGQLYVGAKATANGELTIDPKRGTYVAEVKAGAFAGAKASVEGKVKFPGGGVTGGAEAWAGIGATAEAKVGLKNGKFSAKFSVGAALGIGGKLSFGVEVDFKAIKDKAVGAVKDAGKAIVDGAKDMVVGGAKKAAAAVGNFFKSIF